MRKRRRRFRSGPLVAPELIDNYLNRKLDSYLWLKKVPYKDLISGFEEHFKTGLKRWHHQLVCFSIGLAEPHFAFYLDMGAGKSVISLDLFRYYREHEGITKLLVLSPKAVNVQTWIDQCHEHAPQLRVVPIVGNGKERQAAVAQDGDVYLLSYPGLQTMMTELVRKGNARKRHREIVPDKAREFTQHFDMVVFDESHRLGHHEALVFHECRLLADRAKVRYALSGTPFGRDPMLLWSQFRLVDDGETLGNKLGLFRSAFFHEKINWWGVPEYTFDKKLEDTLHRIIQNKCIYYSETEFSDVPAVSHIKRRVAFSKSAEAQYKEMVRQLRAAKGNVKEMESVFTRMRMVTSGFLSVKTEFGERLVHDFEENPKLDELLTIVDDLPIGKKLIVYHDYRHTGALLAKAFDDLGLKYARISGEVKDQAAQLSKFLHDKKVLYLIANTETAGTGTNLQGVCNYIVYYESPVSPITRKQSEKRVARQGQKEHVYIYDLIVKDSVDEKILGFLDEGKDLFEAICKGHGLKEF